MYFVQLRYVIACLLTFLHLTFLFSDLRKNLEAKVYGQHLAIDSVVKTIRAHLRRPPRKALVLSFHGWTGTGKNLVASVIAQNLYDRGMKSKYVHVLSATKDFARHEKAADYKVGLSVTVSEFKVRLIVCWTCSKLMHCSLNIHFSSL